MPENLLLTNCRLYDRSIDDPLMYIFEESGSITRIGPMPPDLGRADRLDVAGRTIIPGLIDLHVHGAGGGDTSDGTIEALSTMSSSLASLGTTSFLATAMIRPEVDNHHLELVGESVGANLGGANVLGIHLEGPFINRDKRGGIQLTSILAPNPANLKDILAITRGALRMMTIAPEIEGAVPIIRELSNQGIVASFGHSDADYQETKAGLDAGISHATHIFNTMRPIHHRDPGPVPALFERPDVSVQLVCDGTHLNRNMVRYIYQHFGGHRCVCITDGMRAMGLPDGKYVYYGQEYRSEGGVARYLDGTLIGSTCSLLRMMLNYLDFTDCSLAEAVSAVSGTPARVLGLEDRKGGIGPGMDADLVVLDSDRSVWATVIGGHIVYRKDDR